MLIGRSLGRGVFRVFSKENSEDLTNKGGENKESATNCQKPKAPCLRYFRRRGGRWISRALSRLTDVKSGIAHSAKNVNFAAQNVNRPGPANRSQKARRRAQNAWRRHNLGDRNSCLGDRKSCNAYSDAENACRATGQKGRFLRPEHRKFSRIN